MADLAGAKFLRFGRKAEPRMDLSVSEKLHGRDRWARHPVDVLSGIKPDMGGHGRHEDVRGCAQVRHAHGLALEVNDAADPFDRKQFEAAHVYTGDDRYLFAGIDRNEQERREVQSEVDLAAREHFRLARAPIGHHIADVGKAFCSQQAPNDVLRRNANTTIPGEPDRSAFPEALLEQPNSKGQ